MADVVAVTAFKAYCAARLASSYYFVTLHGTGGSALTASTTVYAASGLGELATNYGYTAGGQAVGQGSASTNNVGVTDATWTASGGSIGPASYAALWVNTTNTITGATLVAVKDNSATPQTATTGNAMTGDGITTQIVF